MRELTRRKTILGAMSASAVALAGCLVEDDDDDGAADDNSSDASNDNNSDDDSNDDDSNNNSDDTASEVLESMLYHGRSDCGTGDGEASVVKDGSRYLIDGVATAPDPCHEPVLSDASVDGSDLTVSVDITQRELGGNQECMDCVGNVSYDALADLDGSDGIDRVLVSHGDEEYEVEEFSTDAYVYESSIETTDAGCGEQGVDEADATIEDGQLVVSGRLSASNPCHDARLDNVSVGGGELNVEVSLVAYEYGEGGDGGCTSCIGEIAYEATAELLNGETVEEIVVNHAGGENHTF